MSICPAWTCPCHCVCACVPSLPALGSWGGLRGQSRGQVLSWTHGQGHIPLLWGVLQPLSPSSGGRQGDKAGASAVPLGPPQQGQTRMNTWPLRPPTPLPAAGLGGPLWVCPAEAPEPGWGRTGSHPPPPSSSTFAPVFTLQEHLPCLDGGQEVRVLLGFTQKSPSVGLETLNNCFLSLFIPFIPAFNIPHFQQ